MQVYPTVIFTVLNPISLAAACRRGRAAAAASVCSPGPMPVLMSVTCFGAGLVPWLAGAAAAAGAAAVSRAAPGPGRQHLQHTATATRVLDALESLLRVRMWQTPGLGLGLGRPAAGGALEDFAAAARRMLLCLAGGSAQIAVWVSDAAHTDESRFSCAHGWMQRVCALHPHKVMQDRAHA